MVAELLVLALDYHRTPLRYRHLADPETPLPKGFDKMLRDFCIALSPKNIGATAKTLAISRREIEDASHFFLRQVLLAPGADHYRVLGISRKASYESIRQHYSLIVRVFHPDRSTGESERNSAFTARINAAYNTLRASDARRRYDNNLDARSGGARDVPDLRDFFQPDGWVPAYLTAKKTRPVFLRGTRQIVTWTLISLLAATSVFFAFQSVEKPRLRANPELAKGSRSSPAYLRNGLPGPFQPDRVSLPLADSVPVLKPDAAKTTKDIGINVLIGRHWIGEIGVRAETELNQIIERLSTYYESGDLDGLVGLFTADAKMDNGSGRDYIRASYLDLFSKIDQRRLSFSDVRWRVDGNAAITGKGKFRVSSMLEGDAGWHHGIGTIRFNLTPWNGSYRISQMIHSVEQK